MNRAPLLALLLAACVDTTGSALVRFRVAVAGPPDAQAGQPLRFQSGRGYQVTLLWTRLHVGAIYLNQSVPTAGAQAQSCVLSGIYGAEVTQKVGDVVGLDVDLLSPEPQVFAQPGEGIADSLTTGEVWLMGGDVNAAQDSTVILDLGGTATDATGIEFPFVGQLTIGSNRMIPGGDPAQPGANPICKQRIVTCSTQVLPGQQMATPIDLVPAQGGTLIVRADPRAMLANVDFAALAQQSPSPPHAFGDMSDPGPDLALYNGLRGKVGVYTFEMQP